MGLDAAHEAERIREILWNGSEIGRRKRFSYIDPSEGIWKNGWKRGDLARPSGSM